MNLMGTRDHNHVLKRIALVGFALLVMVSTMALVFHGHLHVARNLRAIRRHFHLQAGAAKLQSPEQLAMSSVAAPTERDEASTADEEATTVQVGLNGDCLVQQLTGSTFSVGVTARRVVKQPGQPSLIFGKLYRFPKSALNAKSEISSVPIDLADVKGETEDLNNVMLSVSVCKESSDSSNCDFVPVAQPFRMAGRYLAATTASGKLNIQLVSDKRNGCSKI